MIRTFGNKKILFLIHTLGIGGAEKVLVNIVNNLIEKGYQVTVMTVIDTGAFRKCLNEKVIYRTIFHLPFNITRKSESGSLQGEFSPIKNILKKIYIWLWRNCSARYIYMFFIRDRYDVEIAFLEGICAKIISKSTNKQSHKYAWIHVDLINENKSDQYFHSLEEEKRCYKQFDRLVCVSKFVQRQTVKKLGIPWEKTITLYNPVDTMDVVKKAQENTINMSGFVFVSVGRLARQKGYDRLIHAAKQLVDDGYSFQVMILGEGPERERLDQEIRKLGLKGIVCLAGYRPNPYPYIKGCTVFICPSRSEGFSTAASEAVILGKPCVVTDCSGMQELFGENNEYGMIVENNEKGIYHGMKTFLTHPDMIEEYSRKSKINAKKFDLNVSVDLLAQELLDER